MIKDSTDKFSVCYFDTLRYKGNIDLQPAFQRKSIWDDNARFGLLDSIYRGYPIPEIFYGTKAILEPTIFQLLTVSRGLQQYLIFLGARARIKKIRIIKLNEFQIVK